MLEHSWLMDLVVEHVLGFSPTYCILEIDKRVVDSNNLDIVIRESVAKDNATNAAEAVDANFHSHS
jgi:hypothetical protein